MSAAAWVGVIAGVVAIASAVLGYAKFMVQAPLQAEKARLEGERDDLRLRLDNQERDYTDLTARYQNLRSDFANLKLGRSGALLKNEIDSRLQEAMDVLEATEASILVPGPPPHSAHFVFLSIYGSAAAEIRKTKVPIRKGIAGRVFATGTLHNSVAPQADPNFFAGLDEKGVHQTKALLTLPLDSSSSTIGVIQFLNKSGERAFDGADERTGQRLAQSLAAKVAEFVSDPANFELLGFSGEAADAEATIVFCDLTASSGLFRRMNVAAAIDCINEYLEQQCDIALRYGATVDKYLGDGAMLRFNVPRAITDGDHAVRATEAAWEMCRAFERLKAGWQSVDLRVDDIYSRIGICCGAVHLATIGHPQFQQITVIGDTVNRASKLCDTGVRDRNVVLVDANVRARLTPRFSTAPVRVAEPGRQADGEAYEITAFA